MMIYDVVMRTIIDLPAEMIEGLAQIGEKEKKSRAALIREAVQNYLDTHQPSDISEAFGLWASHGVDSLAYEREIRQEWERE